MYPIVVSVIIVFLGYFWEKFQPSSGLDEFYGKLFIIVLVVEICIPLAMNLSVQPTDKVKEEEFEDTVYSAQVETDI